MDHSPLPRGHRAKSERDACIAHSACGVFGHCSQFSLSRGSKTFNVEHKTMALFQAPAKRLVKEMLQGIKQFSPFRLQKICVGAIEIEHRTVWCLPEFDEQVKSCLFEHR